MSWLLLILLITGADAETDTFKDAEKRWRAEREESMKAEGSWLNLVGLFWLADGVNEFGANSDLAIVFPPHSTVDRAGAFWVEKGQVRYEMKRGQRAIVDGKNQNKGTLKVGQILKHNHLRMFLVQRGGRLALRVRDLRAGSFLSFEQLDFYRPKKKYVVEGTFEPFEEPKKLAISTVIDTEIELLVPGVIHFKLHGKMHELWPTLETLEDEEFFILLKDQTAESTTYQSGRFLYAKRPNQGNKVILNFNRAINPPCAYTPYATCPLPPAENWLQTPIEAGERRYGGNQDDGSH